MNEKVKNILKYTCTYRLLTAYRTYRHKQWMSKRVARFMVEGPMLLKTFSDAMYEAGIDFWLEFGTLLGYYREHDFIKHDFDLDFGVMREDAPRVKAALESHGFELLRTFYCEKNNGYEECYKLGETTLDIFYFHVEGETIKAHEFILLADWKSVEIGKHYPAQVREVTYRYHGLQEAEFKGVKVQIPAEPAEHLEAQYGKNFMIPDPNFDEDTMCPSITTFNYEDMPGDYVAYSKYI